MDEGYIQAVMDITPTEIADALYGGIFSAGMGRLEGPGRVVFLLPLKGFSRFDQEGGVFWSPEADRAFGTALESNLYKSIPVYEMDCQVNDEQFAAKATELLLKMME